MKNNFIFASLKLNSTVIKFKNVAYENNDKKMESVYSQRIRAGKRRTYFFDVRATRGNDYYLTITESRKRFNEDGYDRHKIFLYKEDFNKFLKGMTEAIDYVKTDLMPDFDFDAFNHDNVNESEGEGEHRSGDHHTGQHSEVNDAPVSEDKEITGESTEETSNHASEHVPTPSPESSATTTPNHNDEEVDKW